MVPDRKFELDEECFCRNLRSARRGAAPDPSGMTCEHLQPLLESERESNLLHQVADLIATASHGPSDHAIGALDCIEEARWWGASDCGQ